MRDRRGVQGGTEGGGGQAGERCREWGRKVRYVWSETGEGWGQL